jgi:hypothetical protein
VINSVCDNLMLTAYAMQTRVVTVDMLDEVSRDLRLDYPGVRRSWATTEATI